MTTKKQGEFALLFFGITLLHRNKKYQPAQAIRCASSFPGAGKPLSTAVAGIQSYDVILSTYIKDHFGS